MRTVIFDFNGTILDVVELCRECLNAMVDRYLDRGEVSRDEYLHAFTFPVKDYYAKIGFDFDRLNFEKIGREWYELYHQNREKALIQSGALETVDYCRQQGWRTVLLSATRQETLDSQCDELSIASYFESVVGIRDIYASSKTSVARSFLQGQDPGEVLFIGDTLHDKDTAEACGADYILVAKGHQAIDVLARETKKIVTDIREVTF